MMSSKWLLWISEALINPFELVKDYLIPILSPCITWRSGRVENRRMVFPYTCKRNSLHYAQVPSAPSLHFARNHLLIRVFLKTGYENEGKRLRFYLMYADFSIGSIDTSYVPVMPNASFQDPSISKRML